MHDPARNAAGHAVAARGGDGVARPVNREPTARREPRLESPPSGEWRMSTPDPSSRAGPEIGGPSARQLSLRPKVSLRPHGSPGTAPGVPGRDCRPPGDGAT